MQFCQHVLTSGYARAARGRTRILTHSRRPGKPPAHSGDVCLSSLAAGTRAGLPARGPVWSEVTRHRFPLPRRHGQPTSGRWWQTSQTKGSGLFVSAQRPNKGVRPLCFGPGLWETSVLPAMRGKSRCHDHLAPTKQADLIMPSIAEICVPRCFTRTRTMLPLRGFCTKGFSFTKSSYSAANFLPNHYHLVLRPLVYGEMGRFMGGVGGTHTMRYHAHYHTSGQGHVYQQRYKNFPIRDDEHFSVVCRYVERNALRAGLVSTVEDWRWSSLWRWLQSSEPEPKLFSPWPMPRLPIWVDRVNTPLTDAELVAVQQCVQRGRPFGDAGWVESIVRKWGQVHFRGLFGQSGQDAFTVPRCCHVK